VPLPSLADLLAPTVTEPLLTVPATYLRGRDGSETPVRVVLGEPIESVEGMQTRVRTNQVEFLELWTGYLPAGQPPLRDDRIRLEDGSGQVFRITGADRDADGLAWTLRIR
jgi:hypothetical protein